MAGLKWQGESNGHRAISGARSYHLTSSEDGQGVLLVKYSNGNQQVFVFETPEKAVTFAENTDKLLQMSDRIEPPGTQGDGEDYPEGQI